MTLPPKLAELARSSVFRLGFAITVGLVGGLVARQALAHDCCAPGAACCHPGAPCCAHAHAK